MPPASRYVRCQHVQYDTILSRKTKTSSVHGRRVSQLVSSLKLVAEQSNKNGWKCNVLFWGSLCWIPCPRVFIFIFFFLFPPSFFHFFLLVVLTKLATRSRLDLTIENTWFSAPQYESQRRHRSARVRQLWTMGEYCLHTVPIRQGSPPAHAGHASSRIQMHTCT